MAATVTERSAGTTGWTDKHTGIAGIAFAVLVVAGLMVSGSTPDYTAADAEWTSWYESSGNTRGAVAAIFLLMLSVVSLVGFVSGLSQRMRRDDEDADALHTVAVAGGVVLGVSLLIGGIVVGAAAGSMEFTDFPVPGADVLKMTEQIGYAILLMGSGVGASLLLGGTSLVSRRSGLLPTWLAIGGLVAAVIMLFASGVFLPMILLPVWAIAVSIVLLRRGASRASTG